MNLSRLEELVKSLADLRTQQKLESPESPTYQALGNGIQEIQQQLTIEYGPYIEEAIFNVHDEYCPDDEIHPLMDYLPTYFEKTGVNGHTRYTVPKGEGLPVEADDFPGERTRLALVPSPTRLVLKCQESDLEEVVWVARELSEA